MSHTNYADPVARCIRGVYEEYLSKWSHRRDRDVDDQPSVSEIRHDSDKLPPSPIPRPSTHSPVFSSPFANTAESGTGKPDQQDTRPSIDTTTPENSRSNDSSNTTHQDNNTIVVDQSPPRTTISKRSKLNGHSEPNSIKPNGVNGQSRPTKNGISPVTKATTKSRPSQLSGKPQSKQTPPQRPTTRPQSTRVQPIAQPQSEGRLRDRRPQHRKSESIDSKTTTPVKRLPSRRRSRVEFEPPSEPSSSESEQEVIRRPRPRPTISSIPPLPPTPTTSKKNTTTTTTKVPTIDQQEAEKARLLRKQEREAAEQAIVEEQVAKLRAQESNIRKCYYCWHYSQPCNLKLKPKCIPCHKNRRSCFGGFTRTEFCNTYEERTGKVHKLAAKDNIQAAKALKRKRSNSALRGRKKPTSGKRRPQRFFLQDGVLKCYRCWDRNLLCDLDTPRCGSCVKGRAACFGFKSNRQEFCEMFEEQTGEKHRWAACFEPGGVRTTSVSNKKRRTRPADSDDDESSELSEDGWNSGTDDTDEDSDDMGNDSGDD